MNHREFSQTWFDRFWCDEDMSAIEDMVDIDVNIRGLTDNPKSGADEIRAFSKDMLTLASFDSVVIDHFMQDGDWAQMLTTFNARSRKDNSAIPFTAQILIKIENGKITEAYNHADFFSLYQQLGLMPKDASTRCLCGSGIG